MMKPSAFDELRAQRTGSTGHLLCLVSAVPQNLLLILSEKRNLGAGGGKQTGNKDRRLCKPPQTRTPPLSGSSGAAPPLGE